MTDVFMMTFGVRIAGLVLMLLMQLLIRSAHHKVHSISVDRVWVRMTGVSLLIVMRRRCLFLLVRTNLARHLEVTLSFEAGSIFHMCVL